MDLLAYAVNRKLKRTGDRLLDYVADRKDVPVSVLEESLGELLAPLDDHQSTMLVEDYPQMLDRYVPVHYTRHPETGTYEVGGEISDRLLEAMELVHGRGRDEVISELIENSTHSLTNSPTVSVGELSLKQLSAQMADLEDSIPEMESFDDIDDLDDVFAEIDAELEELNKFTLDEPEEELYEEVIDELIEELPEEDLVEVIEPESTFEEVEPETESEAVHEEEQEIEPEELPEDIEAVDEVVEEVEEDYDNVPEEEDYDNVPEDLPEEISPEEYAQAEQQLMTEGIRRVYNKLVADLKAHGLDEALGLSI